MSGGAEKVGDVASAPVEGLHEPVTFTKPPVNEVVLGVQFDHDVIDEVRALGEYWPAIRDRFPDIDKQPPLPPLQEDLAHPPKSEAQVQFLQGPPTARYWFLSGDQTRLIQVQADRFILNWRQVSGEEYPRYRALRPLFEGEFKTFLEHLEPERRDAASPAWCEITYINHVEAQGEHPGTHGPLSRVLRAMKPESVSESLPAIEDTQLQQRFLISEREGEPTGRLYMTAAPAFRREDTAPIYVITLVARGRPEPQSREGVLSFFDFGRDLIVRGFKESTTSEMHEQWGLQDS